MEVVAPLLQSGDKHRDLGSIEKRLDDLLTLTKDVKQEEIDIINKVKYLLPKEDDQDDESTEEKIREIKEILDDPDIKQLMSDTFGSNSPLLGDLSKKLNQLQLMNGADDALDRLDEGREAVDDLVDKLLLSIIAAKSIGDIMMEPFDFAGKYKEREGIKYLHKFVTPWYSYGFGQSPDDSKIGKFIKDMQECCATTNNNMGAYYTLLHDEISSINPDPDAIRRIESRLESLRGSLR